MIDLGKVLSLAEKFNLNRVGKFLVERRIEEIIKTLEKAPKSLKGKLRAKIGEKVEGIKRRVKPTAESLKNYTGNTISP
jgi:hypothetical protein